MVGSGVNTYKGHAVNAPPDVAGAQVYGVGALFILLPLVVVGAQLLLWQSWSLKGRYLEHVKHQLSTRESGKGGGKDAGGAMV